MHKFNYVHVCTVIILVTVMAYIYIRTLFHLDLKHICQNLNQFGYGKGTKHGGLSQYTVVPAKYAYLLKTELDDSRAAILERKTCVCSHYYACVC